MGLFSWDCIRCGHPALMVGATTVGVNEWMSKVVVIDKENGDLYRGEYDGYGTVGSANIVDMELFTLWHRACWEVLGKPDDYSGESPMSRDQGYFFEDGAHDLEDPRIAEDMLPGSQRSGGGERV